MLGSFSFAKYLMWKDLVDRTEMLKRSPVVRHLLETPRVPYQGAEAPPHPHMLDAMVVSVKMPVNLGLVNWPSWSVLKISGLP